MTVPNVIADAWRFVARGAADECWMWTGTIDHCGYGKISVKGKGLRAHRVIYELANGVTIADGLFVCHRCDNRACVNPAHLFLGTPADNTKDALAKGRMAFGERAGRSKLSTEDVIAIRRLASEGHEQRAIAARFGTTQPNVGYIVRRETWRHVA